MEQPEQPQLAGLLGAAVDEINTDEDASRGLAVLVTQTNESITISAPSRLPSFGSASDIPPLAEPSDIDGVVVLPLASRPGGSCVAQLTRLYQERLLDSPPTAAASAAGPPPRRRRQR